MKKMFSKRKMNAYKKKSMKFLRKNAMPSALVMVLVFGLIFHKKPVQADAGRGALFGGLSGAAIGGLAGGGKGAGIGAVAGLGLGAIMGSARSRSSDPYRKLRREERKLGKLEDKAAENRSLVQTASTDRKRHRYQRRLAKLENQIARKKQDIARLKQGLGVR